MTQSIMQGVQQKDGERQPDIILHNISYRQYTEGWKSGIFYLVFFSLLSFARISSVKNGLSGCFLLNSS